jgi:hypothetical protein
MPETRVSAKSRGIATFSECGRYRYWLMRDLADQPGDICLFIMLNPSTATEEVNDPTITRCMNFARAWGYGCLEVCNLFAFRAADPHQLMRRGVEPIGAENDRYIIRAAVTAKLIVCAWGNYGLYGGREGHVRRLLRGHLKAMWCLGLTKDGQPRHPLYLPANQELLELPAAGQGE